MGSFAVEDRSDQAEFSVEHKIFNAWTICVKVTLIEINGNSLLGCKWKRFLSVSHKLLKLTNYSLEKRTFI